jgi:uncharacterized circularly permuted ATP-grasp superfamily protein/uncharacterized alpha-E superfamily protein
LPLGSDLATLLAVTTLDTEPVPASPRTHSGAPAVAWDESRAASGEVRRHWQGLVAALGELGPGELASRAEDARRILREHGVSCFSSGSGGEPDRPWELEVVPFAMAAEEWRELSAGLVQRARLLNLVLGDLYGVQRLVRDGFLPAPLIFANPGYLRACQAIRVSGGNYLQIYAADIARGPDGSWRVLADRTQSPAGLGFVLENRSVLSRILPEALQSLRPRSLAEFWRIRRETLGWLAPGGGENLAIAVLTPGLRNEAYFEHAYLARLLGFTLVEGGDLTVRDRRVFLKTLEGLRRVDVILRHVPDAFCDPLELRDDSLLGVPGLVEAARAGQVAVANALGSGLVESPALLPFLPVLATHLLGEELKLPSVTTWWCGQGPARRHVQTHMHELFLRSAFAAPAPQARPGTLTAEAHDAWLARLHERPYEFVGQEEITVSRAPVADGATRPTVLRLFVLFDGQDYSAVPGGVVRLIDQAAMGTVPLPLFGGSKDLWVLPDAGHETEAVHVVTTPSPKLERVASDLPSRSAENLFWLGRYTERLEQLLRVCRAAAGCLATEPGNGRSVGLAELLWRLGVGAEPSASVGEHDLLQANLLTLLFDEGHTPGVRPLVQRIHTSSFGVRDRLSADTWRILNRLGADAAEPPGQLPLVFARSTLNTLVLDLAAFSGMEMENMTRGHGWTFLDLGRRLERSITIARLVEAALRCSTPREWLLEPLLEIADSVITYRRRYFAVPRLAGVLDLLLLDPANPRALAFQLDVLERHAANLPAEPSPEGVAELQQRLSRQVHQLRSVRLEEFDLPGGSEGSVDWLSQLSDELGTLSDLLTHVYFSQVLPKVS